MGNNKIVIKGTVKELKDLPFGVVGLLINNDGTDYFCSITKPQNPLSAGQKIEAELSVNTKTVLGSGNSRKEYTKIKKFIILS